ncbi:MAG: RNA-binding domain-containing protein [Methylocystis sp.]
MEITTDEIDGISERPSESLNTEIKGWIDPTSKEGVAKLVKATFALRNRNGGFLAVGLDDKTLRIDTVNAPPSDIRHAFHTDVIQGIISNYASVLFEIRVGFGLRDGEEVVVIKVEEGVRSPVAVRRDLSNGSGGYLLREGDVFFRTLGANGTPSPAKARPGDWPDIVEICFENREADIGRFLRRHLSGKEASTLIEFLTGMHVAAKPPAPTLRDRAQALLISGEKRFLASVDDRPLTETERSYLGFGMWRIALAVDPPKTSASADQNFLNAALSSNPHLTGWPIWLDSRGFSDRASAPHVLEGAWQALIISIENAWSRHLDFMRLDPHGDFYLQRLLQDDGSDRVELGTALDVVLVILRTAEAIAVALQMVRALGWSEEANLGMAFQWTKLKGRTLSSWANPVAYISGNHSCQADTAQGFAEVPASTPISSIAPYVEEATRDLFIAFDGCVIPSQVIEDWTQRLIERRL